MPQRRPPASNLPPTPRRPMSKPRLRPVSRSLAPCLGWHRDLGLDHPLRNHLHQHNHQRQPEHKHKHQILRLGQLLRRRFLDELPLPQQLPVQLPLPLPLPVTATATATSNPPSVCLDLSLPRPISVSRPRTAAPWQQLHLSRPRTRAH